MVYIDVGCQGVQKYFVNTVVYIDVGCQGVQMDPLAPCQGVQAAPLSPCQGVHQLGPPQSRPGGPPAWTPQSRPGGPPKTLGRWQNGVYVAYVSLYEVCANPRGGAKVLIRVSIIKVELFSYAATLTLLYVFAVVLAITLHQFTMQGAKMNGSFLAILHKHNC